MKNIEQPPKCVFISCFNAYENRIKHIEILLNSKGYQCEYITSDFHHGKKERYSIDRKNVIQIKTLQYHKNFSIKRLLSHFFFSWRAFNEIKKIKPDILYVMLPPNSLAHFASIYKRKNPVRLIFDIYDLWPETFPSKHYKKVLALPFTLWGNLRNFNLKNADIVVAECDLFLEKLIKYIVQTRSATLYPVKLSKTEICSSVNDDEKVNICYLGSINNIIDIDGICELLGRVNKLKPVKLHIIGDGEKRNELISRLENSGVEVIYYGRIYEDDRKQEVFNNCILGINMMKDSVCVGLTLKSIDYLHAGLPLLNNIKGDTYNLVNKYKIGINVSENFDKTVMEILKLKADEVIEIRRTVREVYKEFFSLDKFNSTVDEMFSSIQNNNRKDNEE